jgi:hypothetical protein
MSFLKAFSGRLTWFRIFSDKTIFLGFQAESFLFFIIHPKAYSTVSKREGRLGLEPKLVKKVMKKKNIRVG